MALCVFRPLLSKVGGLRFCMLTVLTNIRSTKVLWLVENLLQLKKPSMEDDLRWKMYFGVRHPSVEDDLGWKTTWVEDDFQWKTNFGGR